MPTTVYSDEVACPPRAGTLYDVLELILDRGMVIDVFIRVSLVGIEILKIDARIVVASVDTYLRFAEACNRLDLERDSRSTTVPELFGGGAAKAVGKRKVKKAAEAVGDTVRKAVGSRDDEESDESEESEEEQQERPRRRASAGSGARRRRRVEA
ncbi:MULTISPECIES: gas vesicle structural protein GvpA [unclassified Streptomyces]|uniref:gas vesicle structural protein GvpA n=1 Tax=unclassified Streptomyces TaxID=2593676 RepID=UPI002DDC6008|nr:gas vesicle structural protein GvpA [Streptomyces sp. NBC_01750]WSA98455.1 gas vesicle structural protein GvpA [Streptomyces sp. NBC_01794]WSD37009.1 gas vesicle structural protein GvpA [Streptomyces sp. NBC_01750]